MTLLSSILGALLTKILWEKEEAVDSEEALKKGGEADTTRLPTINLLSLTEGDLLFRD